MQSIVTHCAKADQPKATNIQGLLATSTEHELFLVWGQGCVPGAKTSQAKNYQTPKCKERNNWIDESVTKAQVCNNVRIECWKTHLLFLNSHRVLSHPTTPTSIVLIDSVGAGLAKNEPCARLPSPPPVLSSQKQIHKCLTSRRNQSRSAQVSHQLHTQGFVCQWSQPGSHTLFFLLCATLQLTPTTLWRTCLTQGLNTSKISFHNCNHSTIKCA